MADVTAKYIPTGGQILVCDAAGRDIASAVVEQYGDRWRIRAVRGGGFASAWPEIVALCRQHGMWRMEGYLTPAHARLVKRALRDEAVTIEVEAARWQADIGRPMCWLVGTVEE